MYKFFQFMTEDLSIYFIQQQQNQDFLDLKFHPKVQAQYT